jgi:hypothetical protein
MMNKLYYGCFCFLVCNNPVSFQSITKIKTHSSFFSLKFPTKNHDASFGWEIGTFLCHASPPTILPSSLTSSYHLSPGLPLGLVVSKSIYNTVFGILFSSILCTCPNQRNLCNLIVSVMVGF